MSEDPTQDQPENRLSDRPPVGNLTDFVEGVDGEHPLDLEVAVDSKGKVVIFHDKPFTKEIGWFEYDVTCSKLDFIIGEGDVRDIGLPLSPAIAKHMQNTHQILLIYMNDETGEAEKGDYIPLIIHQS